MLAEGLVLGEKLLLVGLGACAFLSLLYLLWHADPAITLSVGFFLTPFAGNWGYVGFPHGIDPTRIMLTFGIFQVIVRSPAVRRRPPFRIRIEHWLMLLALLYVAASAIVAHTFFSQAPFFELYDIFGVMPFATFLVAPYVFRTARQREYLLVTMVLLGAYLSLTTVFAAVHLNALVFPRYILNPSLGIHYGRGRGPFLEAVENGLALAVCALACAIATVRWAPGSRRRQAAVVVGLLCIVGAFLSLERSVWIAGFLGLTIAMASSTQLRRHLIPILVSLVLVGGLAFVGSPSLRAKISSRVSQQSSIWDRNNLNTAGLNMVEAKPLTGFGWQTFQANSELYFTRNPDYPLTATREKISNFPLGYAAELGIPGVTLWMLVLVVGVGRALMARHGPPEQELWRIGLIGVSVMFVIIAVFVPPNLFPNLTIWLWAGVVLGASESPGGAARIQWRASSRTQPSVVDSAIV